MATINENNLKEETAPEHWCSVCGLDLQSARSLEEHRQGRKHQKRCFQQQTQKRPPTLSELPQLDGEDDLFQRLATGQYQSIVVLTGAGVSTAAGVPDFRSAGGLFEKLRQNESLRSRFPQVVDEPEYLLSRRFCNTYPKVFEHEVYPLARHAMLENVSPTTTHKFCAWLEQQGWLRRIYTQNIDGLHTHTSLTRHLPSLPQKVVECHGSLERGDLVMYGDPLPKAFAEACDQDFGDSNNNPVVDLVIVFGTSLQVAPVCGVPNMAPRGGTRVLVNRRLDQCLQNDFSTTGLGVPTSTPIGRRKHVTLRPLWSSKEGRKRWSQLLVESDCDTFCERFFASHTSQHMGHKLAFS